MRRKPIKTEILDRAILSRFIDILNSALEMDRDAMDALIKTRIQCNKVLGDHPTIQIAKCKNFHIVGLLGLINGLCGIDKKGHGPIEAMFGNDGKLTGFTLPTSSP